MLLLMGDDPASELTTHHLSLLVYGEADATGAACLSPLLLPLQSSPFPARLSAQ